MPYKQRHQKVDLGTVNGNSADVDASAADFAILYVKNDSGSTATVAVQASPQPFGESATWYDFGESQSVATGKSKAWPIPQHVYSEFMTSRRLRITTTQSVGLWVELVREIS